MDGLRCLLLLAIAVTCSLSECPDGWTKFQTSCYLFSHLKLDFFDSENFCNQEGGYLVHIDTLDENAFVKSFCDDLKVNRRWIGLTDQVVENRWLWHGTNNSPTFFDWGPSQPNEGKHSNCAVLWETQLYTWGDDPCSNKYESICERGLNSESGTIVG